MASYQVRQRDPLLDRNTQAILERRGKELLGVGLLVVTLALVAMLGSYVPSDPGWMVATDEPARNMLGRGGAAIASTLIIIAGMGAWGLPLVMGAWGLRFLLHLGEDRALGRVIFALIAIALASVYAATHVPGSDWVHSFGLGGLFGDTVLGALLGVAPVTASFGLKLLSVIIAVALIAMMLFVLGFDAAELRAIARFLLVGLVVTYAGVVTALRIGAAGTMQGAGALRDRAAVKLAERRMTQAERAADAAEYAREEAAEYARAEVQAQSARSRVIHAAQPQARSATHQTQTSARSTQGFQAPQPLNADPRPLAGSLGPLRADPRPQPEQPVPAPAQRSLLSRVPGLLKRAPDPMPELVEHFAPDLAYDDMPSEDRIKARISDVIRAKARRAPVSPPAPVVRPEPPVMRQRRPAPLIANLVRPAAPMAAMAAPPVAAQVATPAFAPKAPFVEATDPMDMDHDWDIDDSMFENDHSDAANAYAVEAATSQAPELDDEEDWHVPEVRPQPRLTAISRPAIQPEIRRVVQNPLKRPVAISRKAQAEAEPRLKFEDHFPAYEAPPLNLLMNPDTITRHHLPDEALEENARMLENVLDDYGVKGEIVSVRPGPVVTMYELEPAAGVKASRVIGLAEDIARSMSALSARVSTVPGRSVIGIELPNATREKVVLREILSARDFGDSSMRLPLALGKDIGGEPIVANLAKMPHLLIAGTTGSGKSVAINTMILSLLYKLTPEECRLIMIDPKMLELSV
ncbi:MAG: DNA translocase FtsK 4TM domain-containing protein, partial [Gemmobacter sp.]|nr:DNA translocase FtsK 4TM domain-containing protein [Gemmobacter sp.]